MQVETKFIVSKSENYLTEKIRPSFDLNEQGIVFKQSMLPRLLFIGGTMTKFLLQISDIQKNPKYSAKGMVLSQAKDFPRR